MKKKSVTGLIGYPLSHSFSKSYFEKKFLAEGTTNFVYNNFEIEDIGEFQNILETNPDLIGLNVTIPHKQNVIPFLDFLSPEAEAIGAVNTIKIEKSDNRIICRGFNTDYLGFDHSLDLILDNNPDGALILGTGGASKAVEYTLRGRNIPFKYISRQKKGNNLVYSDINEALLRSHNLIINTTPLGMFPDIEEKPSLPYHFLNKDNYLIDLIYNPEKTLFLHEGEKAGAKVLNGLPMLIAQAEASWKIWNGTL